MSRESMQTLAIVVILLLAALPGAYVGYVAAFETDRWLYEASRPEDTVMVIVAARDLAPGPPITEEDLYAVEIPPRWLPSGRFFLSPEGVVGRTAATPIFANEFVRAERLR